MLSALQQLISGTAGGPAAGEKILEGYNVSKNGAKGSAMRSLAKGSQPLGQASGAPTMNVGAAGGNGGGGGFPAFGGAPAAAATPNMGATIIPGNIKSPLQLTSANVATGGMKTNVFGPVTGGRRRRRRSSKRSKKARKSKSRKSRK